MSLSKSSQMLILALLAFRPNALYLYACFTRPQYNIEAFVESSVASFYDRSYDATLMFLSLCIRKNKVMLNRCSVTWCCLLRKYCF